MLKKLRVIGSLLLISAGVTAGATTINFEQYSDGTQITNQYPGITFTNALELTADPITGTLDAVAFPPHSGIGVVTNIAPAGTDDPLFGQPSDPNAMLGVAFGTDQTSVSFYYTAQSPITVNLFDSADNLLGSVTGASDMTFPQGVATGTSDLLNISSATAFSSFLITDGSGIQNGFVIDDLTYGGKTSGTGGTTGSQGSTGSTGGTGETGGNSPGGGDQGTGGTGLVPEPGSLVLLGSGMVGVVEMMRRRLQLGGGSK